MIFFLKHIVSLTISLRCYYNSLSGIEVNEFLHLLIELTNSASENGSHFVGHLFEISSSRLMLIWQSWAILKVEYRACQSSLISRQEQLLYLIASIARSLCLLTQFMSSHRPCLLLVISWIFWSKSKCFVLLTMPLNCFKSLIFVEDL